MNSEKIIQQNCGNIRERLLACRSKSVAFALKDRLCSELKLNCQSNMVNNVLNEHVDQLIQEIFDQNGKNKYLEAHYEAH
jgi:hypothetical protein